MLSPPSIWANTCLLILPFIIKFQSYPDDDEELRTKRNVFYQYIESYLHNHCQIINITSFLHDKSAVSHRPHDKVFQAKSTQSNNEDMAGFPALDEMTIKERK